MDNTIKEWLHELGAHAYNLGMSARDYVHSQGFTFTADDVYTVHDGWLAERNKQMYNSFTYN